MKRCPRCDQIFTHELLKFCRFDGVRLVNSAADEATTMLLSPPEVPEGKIESLLGFEVGQQKQHAEKRID